MRNIVVPKPVIIMLFLVFLFVFIVLPGFCIVFGVYYLIESNASSRWPTADGKVISSSVESYEFEETVGKSHVKRKRTGYRPIVVYEFAVSERTYSSQDLSFGDYGSTDPSHARAIVGKYPAGATVTVYYSPTSPERSVLEPGVTGLNFLYALFGLPCFLVGVVGVAVFVGLWRVSKQRIQHIYEAVLNVELSDSRAGDEFYLFIEGKDPPRKMLRRFQVKWPRLQPGSEAPRGTANRVSLDGLTWITRNTAELRCGVSNWTDDRSERYRVVAKGASWVVEDRVL